MIIDFSKKSSWFSLPGLAILTIFLSGFLSAELILVIEVLLLCICIKRIKIDKNIIFFIIFLFVQSSIMIVFNNDSWSLASKQLIGISIELCFWSTIINQQNWKKLLILYKQGAMFAAYISILQFIFYKIGLVSWSNFGFIIKQQLSTTHGRSASIFSEPSAFALIVFPIVYLGLYSLLGKNRKYIIFSKYEIFVLLVGYYLSFSSVGYVGIILALFQIILEYNKLNIRNTITILGAVIAFFLLYKYVNVFQERINDTFGVFFFDTNFLNTNLSTQTLEINKIIALDSWKNTFGFGSGLGSHVNSYNKYIGNVGLPWNYTLLLNKDDANSLLLRIISELGFPGLLILGIYIFKYHTKSDFNFDFISNMCLLYIILRLLRSGHYFNYGFGMFLVLYFRINLLFLEKKNGSQSISNDVHV